MTSLELTVRFLGGVACLLGNAYFVTTEFAMTRVRQFDREEFQESAGLRRAWEMTEELEIYLTACQVGITVTSILLGVVFEPAVTQLLHPLLHAVGLVGAEISVVSIAVAVVFIQLAHTVWGEQAPTYLGVERSRQVAGLFAPALYWWTTVMYPFIYVGDWLAKKTLAVFGITIERSWTEEKTEPPPSKGSLRRQMGEVLSRGELSEERTREVLRALEIGELETREIMVPRDEIYALSTENEAAENFDLLCEQPQARFPLIGETLEEYLGVVYAPSLFPEIDGLRNGETSWEEVAVEPLDVRASLSVAALVDRFQEEHQELALVVEKGRVVGLVTATDAFEAIIGDLEDPFD